MKYLACHVFSIALSLDIYIWRYINDMSSGLSTGVEATVVVQI
jgi:hypothetical protein